MRNSFFKPRTLALGYLDRIRKRVRYLMSGTKRSAEKLHTTLLCSTVPADEQLGRDGQKVPSPRSAERAFLHQEHRSCRETNLQFLNHGEEQ